MLDNTIRQLLQVELQLARKETGTARASPVFHSPRPNIWFALIYYKIWHPSIISRLKASTVTHRTIHPKVCYYSERTAMYY